MIEVAHIRVRYEGDVWRTSWTITAEAHSVGLAVAVGDSSVHMGDDLGDPDGALKATHHLYGAARGLGVELGRQWGIATLF